MAAANYSIIIGDDDLGFIEYLASHLHSIATKFGDSLQIYKASSALQILSIISEQDIDVLFLDYDFKGGMSGEDIILDSIDKLANKFIVLVSAYPDEGMLSAISFKFRQRLSPRFQFLRKPVEHLQIEDTYLQIDEYFRNLPYPFPIAYPYHILSTQHTAHDKIRAIKDLFESICIFSALVLLADFQRLETRPKFALLGRVRRVAGFTDWLSLLAELLSSQGEIENYAFMPQLPLLFRRTGHLSLMYKFGDEVARTELGHGFVQEEGYYASLVKEYSQAIASLYNAYRFASRYELLLVEQIDFKDVDKFIYKARSFMGISTRFSVVDFVSEARLSRDRIYLTNAQGNYLSLHPLLIYRNCNICNKDRLYMLDRIQEDELIYNALCNHTYSSNEFRELRVEFYRRFGGIFLETVQESSYLRIGQPLDSKYEVEEIIGSSNHSIAVKAWDIELKAAVVIKLLRLDLIQDNDVIHLKEQLLEEGRLLFNLEKHPNISQVYGTIHEPAFGLVMQWVEGEPLQRKIFAEEQLSVGRILKLGIDIAGALAHIHSYNIVHYDVIPNNIIITNDPNHKAVLIDFDIAHAATKRHSNILGNNPQLQIRSTNYSAPEYFTNAGNLGKKSDVFSLGVILYELLTQQSPFPFGNDPARYNGLLPRPAQHNTSDELYSLMCSILSEELESRPTALELQEHLSNLLNSLE